MSWLHLFWLLIGRFVWHHRVRTGLTCVGVVLGVAVAVAVQLANHTAFASFERSVAAITGDAAWQIVADSGDLDERLLARVRPITGLGTLRPVLDGVVAPVAHPELGLSVLGIDLTQVEALDGLLSPVKATWLLAQPYPVVILSDKALATMGWRPGQLASIKVRDRVVTVRIGPSRGSTARTAGLDPFLALMDLSDAQELFARLGRLDRVDVAVLPGIAPETVRAALEPLLPKGVNLGRPSETAEQAQRMLLSFRVNLLALSFVALIVGAYLIYNTVAISVVQRRREVGILRSLGMLKRHIIALFLLEAGLIGLLGGLIGVAVGALLAQGAVAAVGQTVNAIYVSTPVTEVLYDPFILLGGLAMGLGLALLAAALPAWEASCTPAASVTRLGTWEERQREQVGVWAVIGAGVLGLAGAVAQLPPVTGLPVGGYVSAALLIVAFSLWGPVSVAFIARLAAPWVDYVGGLPQLALRNFRRAVGRNAVAIASLMVGLAMMVGVSTMVTSFRGSVVAWVNHTLPGTYYLKSELAQGARQNITIDAQWLTRLRALPGVAAVEGFRTSTVNYDGVGIKLGASDMAVLAEYGSLMLTEAGDPRAAYRSLINTDRVLVSEALTLKHGVKRGDRLVLPTPQGPHAFEVVAVYRDYASDQGYILMDRGTYQRLWHDGAITDMAVYAKPQVDGDRLYRAIRDCLGTAPIQVTSSAAMREQVLTVFDQTFAITDALHVIAMAVSLLGVVGALYTLVLERQREWSILRQLGLGVGQLMQLVVWEAAWIGVAGVLLGSMAGIVMSWLLVWVINRQSFGWSVDWQAPGWFLIQAGTLVVACAMLAGLYPARIAARASIAEGLRSE